MEDNLQVGWLAAIIVGAFAGWLAEKFMKSNQSLVVNIILGVIGAIIANGILSWFDIALGGLIGFLGAGFLGACLLIWVSRLFGKKKL